MTFGFTLILNIIHGKTQWKLKAQGLRLWVVLKFKNPNKISSIEMLLIDENFETLLVNKYDLKPRTTKHIFKVLFMSTISCTQTKVDEIPYIIVQTREDLLLDVIGHVVEKDDVKEIDKNGNKHKFIDIVFQDLE
ncbi:hypothetical protein HKD37_14G040082 [Glycine soja]